MMNNKEAYLFRCTSAGCPVMVVFENRFRDLKPGQTGKCDGGYCVKDPKCNGNVELITRNPFPPDTGKAGGIVTPVKDLPKTN
jgi:hypothetical protein